MSDIDRNKTRLTTKNLYVDNIYTRAPNANSIDLYGGLHINNPFSPVSLSVGNIAHFDNFRGTDATLEQSLSVGGDMKVSGVLSIAYIYGDGSRITGIPGITPQWITQPYGLSYDNDVAIGRNTLTANTRVDISGNTRVSNNLSIGNSVTIEGPLRVNGVTNLNNDLIVSGNLQVSGTQTTINTTQVNIKDNIVVLADNNTTNNVPMGILGTYSIAGGLNYTGFLYDPLGKKWWAVDNIDYTNPNSFSGVIDSSRAILYIGETNTLNMFTKGFLSISDQIYLDGSLNISGNAILKQNISINSSAYIKNSLSIGGSTILRDTLDVSGQTTLKNSVYISGQTTLENVLSISNREYVHGGLYLDNKPSIGSGLVADSIPDPGVGDPTTLYTINASSDNGFDLPKYAYDKTNRYWGSASLYESSDQGMYTGFETTNNIVGGAYSSLNGEWLDITLPYSYKISNLKLLLPNNSETVTKFCPYVFYLLAENIDGSWQQLISVDQYNWDLYNPVFSQAISTNNLYHTFRIVVTRAGLGLPLMGPRNTVIETVEFEGFREDNTIVYFSSQSLDVSGLSKFRGDINISGDIDLSGNEKISNTLSVSKQVYFKNILDVSENVYLRNNLSIYGNSYIDGNVTIGGNLNLAGDTLTTTTIGDLIVYNTTSIASDTAIRGTLDICGNTTIFNSLNVSGYTTFENGLSVSGKVDIRDSLDVSGNLTVDGQTILTNTINISGYSTIDNGLSVSGKVDFRDSLDVSGNLTVDHETILNSLVNISGYTTIDDGLSISSDVAIRGNTDISLNLTVDGLTRLTNSLNVSGYTTIDDGLSVSGKVDFRNSLDVSGNLTVDGLTRLTNSLNVSGYTTIDDGLSVSGKVDLRNNLDISGSLTVDGQTRLTNSLNVSGYTTIDDGLSVSGKFDLRGSLDVSGNLTVDHETIINSLVNISGYTTIDDGLSVSGKIDFRNSLDVSGNLTVDGQTRLTNTLNVSGYTTIDSGLSVSNDVDIRGSLDISHNLIVDNDTILNGLLNISGYTTIDDGLSISGDIDIRGNLDVSFNLTVDGELIVNNTANIIGATYLHNILDVTSSTTLRGSTTISGQTDILNKLRVYGATDLYDTLRVSGATTIEDSLSVQTTTTSNIVETNTIRLPPNAIATEVSIDSDILMNNTKIVFGGTNSEIHNITNMHGKNNSDLTIRAPSNNNIYLLTNSTNDSNKGIIVDSDGDLLLYNSLSIFGQTYMSNTVSIGKELYIKEGLAINIVRNPDYILDVSGNSKFEGDVHISGNITFDGSSVQLNTTSLTVNDNVIAIADGNTDTTIPLGIIAHTKKTGSVPALVTHSGLIKNQQDGYWWLFNQYDESIGLSFYPNDSNRDNLKLDHLSAQYIDLSGSQIIKENLYISGSTEIANNLSVTGKTGIYGSLSISGATSLKNTVGISGATTLASTLDISGMTRLQNSISIWGITNLANAVNISGATSIKNTVGISGATNLASTLDISGMTRLQNSISIWGITNLANAVNISGATTIGGNTVISGATSIYNKLDVTGAVNLKDTVGISGATTIASTLNITGNTGIGGSLSINGITTIANAVRISGSTNLTNKLDISGSVRIQNTLSISDQTIIGGNVTIGSNTATYKLNLIGTNNGGSGTSVDETMLYIEKPNIANQSYTTYAKFNLSKGVTGYTSGTKLDIILSRSDPTLTSSNYAISPSTIGYLFYSDTIYDLGALQLPAGYSPGSVLEKNITFTGDFQIASNTTGILYIYDSTNTIQLASYIIDYNTTLNSSNQPVFTWNQSLNSSHFPLNFRIYFDMSYPYAAYYDGTLLITGYFKFYKLSDYSMLTMMADNAALGICNNNPQYTLDVSGTTRLQNTVLISGATTLANTLNISGVTTIASTLSIGGNTTISGNVGIGNTNPTYKLDVNGQIGLTDRLWGYATASNMFWMGLKGSATDASRVAIGFSGDSTTTGLVTALSFQTNGINRMTINSLGNVGIGTNNPQSSIHIGGSTSTTDTKKLIIDSLGVAAIEINGDIGNSAGEPRGTYIQFSQDGKSIMGRLGYTQGGDGLDSCGNALTDALDNSFLLHDTTGYSSLQFAGSTKVNMTIKNNGNVGIGNNSPNAPLQFANTVVNRKVVLYDGYNNDHQYFGFGINNSMLRYQVDSAGCCHAWFSGSSSTTSNELMRIQGNGNVGIGTNNPLSLLSLNKVYALSGYDTDRSNKLSFLTNFYSYDSAGTPTVNLNQSPGTVIGHSITYVPQKYNDVGSSNAAWHGKLLFNFENSTDGTTPLTLTSNNRVGIGVTNPSGLLNITKANSSGTTQEMFRTNFDANWGLRLVQNYVGAGDIHYEWKSKFNGLEYDVLSFRGTNVGIGVATPTTGDKLEVAGVLRVHTGNNYDAIRIYADGANGYIQGQGDETGIHIRSANGNVYLADDRGNVGIGNVTPGDKLEVAGGIKATSFYVEKATHTFTSGTANDGNKWFKIAQGAANTYGTFLITYSDSGEHATVKFSIGTNYNNWPFIKLISSSSYGNNLIEQIRLSLDNASIYNSNYVEIYLKSTFTTPLSVDIYLLEEKPGSALTLFSSKTSGTSTGYTYYSLPINILTQGINTYGSSIVYARSGAVGIGTADPQAILEVLGNSSANFFNLLAPTAGTGSYIYHNMGKSTTNYNSFQGKYYHSADGSTTANYYGFSSYGQADAYRIYSSGKTYFSGNVGVGTTDPQKLLTVNTTSFADDAIIGAFNSSPYSGTNSSLYGGRLELGKIENGGYQPMGRIISRPNAADSGFGHMSFWTRNNQTMTEQMRIRHDGNVGINNTDPSEKLHVTGTVLIGDGSQGILKGHDDHHSIYMREAGSNLMTFYEYGDIRFMTNGIKTAQTEKMRIKDNGNVGIGTNNPYQNKLVVYSTTGSVMTSIIGIGQGDNYSGLEIKSGTAAGYLFLNSNGRTVDGGASTLNLRNDSGNLRLQSNSGGQGIIIDSANYINLYNPVRVNSTNTIEFGLGITKAQDCGRIGYDTYDTNALCIVGSHPSNTTLRAIRMWDRLGIGINPSYPLHINGAVNFTYNWYASWISSTADGYGWGGFDIYIGSFPVSMALIGGFGYSNYGFIAASDRRIKKDIVDASDCLAICNKIRIRNYNYIDKRRGDHCAYGVIAQEIADVFPEAVNKQVENIPSIYKLADFVEIDTSFIDINNIKLDITINKPHDLSLNDIATIVFENSGEYENYKVVEIINIYSFSIILNRDKYKPNRDNSGNVIDIKNYYYDTVRNIVYDISNNNIDLSLCVFDSDNNLIDIIGRYPSLFIYGKQINDFLAVDKTRLATLAIGAINELDNKLSSKLLENNDRIDNIEINIYSKDEIITQLQTTITNQQQTINTLSQQLEALQNTLNNIISLNSLKT